MDLWYEALVVSVCGLSGVAKQITSIILNPTGDHYACVRHQVGLRKQYHTSTIHSFKVHSFG